MLKYIGAPLDKGQIILIAVIIVFFVLYIVLTILRQKKGVSQQKQMLDSIKVGNKIKTIGGLIGTIVDFHTLPNNEKTIVLECGEGDKVCYLEYDINAILQVIKSSETSDDTAEKSLDDSEEQSKE